MNRRNQVKGRNKLHIKTVRSETDNSNPLKSLKPSFCHFFMFDEVVERCIPAEIKMPIGGIFLSQFSQVCPRSTLLFRIFVVHQELGWGGGFS